MEVYLIHVEGRLVSRTTNINLHQFALDTLHKQGYDPTESRIKNV